MNKSKEQAQVLTPAQIKAYSFRRAIDVIAITTIAKFNLTEEQATELNAQASFIQRLSRVPGDAFHIQFQNFINACNNFRQAKHSAQTLE